MNDKELIEGMAVHYKPRRTNVQNGIVKEIREDGAVFVVYHCDNDWLNYKNYTGANTKITDLEFGWVDDEGVPMQDPFMDNEGYLEVLRNMSVIEASKIGMLQQAVLFLNVPFLKRMLKDMQDNNMRKASISIPHPSPMLSVAEQKLESSKIRQLELYIEIAENSKVISESEKELGQTKDTLNQLKHLFK